MRRGGGRRGSALGLMTMLVVVTGGVGRAAEVVPEPQVKAEFMERITRFVDWPDDSFGDETSPFVLCVIGDHPFGDYLTRMAKDRRLRGRRIALTRVTDLGKLGTCHLVFVARSEDERLDKILAQTAARPILTVSDTGGFGDRGVLVNFYRERDNVRFEINLRSVERSGLRFSSKILRLARLVGRTP